MVVERLQEALDAALEAGHQPHDLRRQVERRLGDEEGGARRSA